MNQPWICMYSPSFIFIGGGGVHSLSCVLLLVTPWTVAHQAPLSPSISQSLLRFMSIELVMLSNYLILSFPLLFLLSVFPIIRESAFSMSQLFSSNGQSTGDSTLASIFPINTQDWYPLGWTDLISCCPGDSPESSPTPQFKASILQHSVFFMVQLSHPYMTTGKTTAWL